MGYYSRRNKSSRANDASIATPTTKAHKSIFTTWALPCSICGKFRTLATEEQYERIKNMEDPFTCNNKPNTSCNDPPDVEFDEEDGNHWFFDPPNTPKTPGGFTRVCAQASAGTATNGLRMYYIAPTGRRLRTMNEVEGFLASDSEYSDLSTDNFSFAPPVLEPHEDDDDEDDDGSSDDDDYDYEDRGGRVKVLRILLTSCYNVLLFLVELLVV